MQPVVHIEVLGGDPERLCRFYAALFGWQFDVGDAADPAVPQPGQYGFITGLAPTGPTTVGTSLHHAVHRGPHGFVSLVDTPNVVTQRPLSRRTVPGAIRTTRVTSTGPENLLLLCGKHHRPVDRHELAYSVAELMGWRAAQQASAGAGTPLTESDVRSLHSPVGSARSL